MSNRYEDAKEAFIEALGERLSTDPSPDRLMHDQLRELRVRAHVRSHELAKTQQGAKAKEPEAAKN